MTDAAESELSRGIRPSVYDMVTETIVEPTAADIQTAVSQVTASSVVAVLFAECEIEYEGRAAGYTGPGDRIVLCKPDGTLLVHRPTGNDPVNWQPPGGTFSVTRQDDALSLTARRSDPPETVTIRLNTVYSLTLYRGEDSAALQLHGTEADMHRYIRDHPDEIEEGLRIIEHERDTPYGSIDLFARDATGQPVLLEVKRRQATQAHVDQLKRYMSLFQETNPDARGVLVAPAASDDVKRSLRDNGLEFVALDAFTVDSGASASMSLSDFVDD